MLLYFMVSDFASVNLIFQHPSYSWLRDKNPGQNEQVNEKGNEGS